MEIIFTLLPSWFFTTLFMLICIFIWRSTYGSSKGAYKLPPSPTKLPIIGNLHQILTKPRHEALWDLSKKHGPIMQIHIGSKPYLIISSPTMAKQILKTQDHVFCSRPLFEATKQLTYNFLDIAFSPHSSHWRDMRKLLVTELLGPKRAKLFKSVLVMEIETMISTLSSHPSNTQVNLNRLFLTIVKGLVCKVAFGNNYREEPLKGPSWEVMLSETMLLLNGSVGDSFPWLGRIIDNVTGWNSRLSNGFSNLDAYIDTLIDDHRKHNLEEISDDEKDFVHSLLELSSTANASGLQLTNGDIKALIMDVLTGGIDTTVVTMVWAMSEIIRNPRVMQKLQKEIRDCTGRIEHVNELDIAKMKYLKMVVKETLRLHTPAPLLIPHECLTRSQICGYDVFPGTSAIINAWGIARDQNNWGDNAEEFYPERFENLDVDFGIGNFEMVPFGGGRRACPAMNTSPTNIEFLLAHLLYWFDWKFPVGVTCEDMNMEATGTLVLEKKLPLHLIPTKHKWQE
ncbi:parthenolide synthase-like [Rutidosis leptorrhynchoides]|uniref:parthenolide synthase-like n=1 Tax=Rutidosis leptorrhynchoides TaxID=125765 RepID=UPI003A99A6AC